ncbi:MAG: hypothetical protein IT437_07370 [Phycisphaerales bacterium]|nr:hypothetical protein [Phycisphaerales bacterium]
MRALSTSLSALLMAAAGVHGQSGMVQPSVTVGGGSAPASTTVGADIVDPDSPVGRQYAAQQRRRVDMERALYKIRAQYIRDIRNPELRQIGITKIRDFTDPAVFPSLLKIFGREGDDVRVAILDHLADQQTAQADATLATAAVYGDTAAYRKQASDRLIRRTGEAGGVPYYVRATIAGALRDGSNEVLASAANLANVLDLVDAIPMLINAQIGGGTTAQLGSGGGDTSLAYILVGKQQAFVSDLTPIVADSAVGFDPTLSVVTEGVVLRVIDAVVLTYRVEVHNALVGLSSRAWGQPTDRLGWDNKAWERWYVKEFKPAWDRAHAGTAGPG